ncbi:Sterol regulatory element-binding protein 1 [Blomia tropicalis]|nr:Sterol regulatory element-binding protein 1 [Blomia tropicalis]
MEELIKCEFTLPMMNTFDSTMDTSQAAYYYQQQQPQPQSQSQSIETNSIPDQINCSNYSTPTYDSNVTFYLPPTIDQSTSNNLYYQQEFADLTQTGQQQLEQQQHQPQPDPINDERINELSKLFTLSDNIDDKMAIQSKIKQILLKHINTKDNSSQESEIGQLLKHQNQSLLITPPLSPNGDDFLYMGGSKGPKFPNVVQPNKSVGIGMSQSLNCTISPQMIKMEPSPISTGKVSPNFIGNLDNIIVENMAPQEMNVSQLGMIHNGTPNNSKVYFGSKIPQSTTNPTYFQSNGLLLSNESNECIELKGKSTKSKLAKSKLSKNKCKLGGDLKSLSLGSNPKQSQKRSAHLSAEFRYRTKLNDKIGKLRTLVGQKVHLSKSAVLTRSIERIIKLQKLTMRLHESNVKLQHLVSKLTEQINSSNGGMQQHQSSNKLMSIKELTKSLGTNGNQCQMGATNSSIDLVEINRLIGQQTMMEPEASLTDTLSLLQSDGESVHTETSEVIDFDHLLDQF